ncbi:MAG: AarF/UbiB family protein, partial [Arenimonas sp.]
ERLRHAMEELGPTFVKLGQLLATRVDLFGPEWIAEFEKLQDHAPLISFEEVQAQMQVSFMESPEMYFSQLDENPLAAGSIAQVHRATLHDGSTVIIKVRRPGIRELIDADMRLLQRLAKTIETELPEWRCYHPVEVVRRFKSSLYRELDLAAECHNAQRIAQAFIDHSDIVIPKVYWELTSECINVQEFVAGIPAHDLEAVDAAGLDRKKLAMIGANTALKMMLEDGFFHADPHPGNLFYLPGNRVALIDFGMVGHLSDKRREQVIDLLQGLVQRDALQITDILSDWAQDAELDSEKLAQDVDNFIDQYHGVPLKQLNLSAMLGNITVILRDNKLALPSDLAMLMKVFVTLESIGRKLDPDFDMVSMAMPIVGRVMRSRYSTKAIAKRGQRAVKVGMRLLSSLPDSIREILQHARSGKIKVSIDIERLQHLGEQLDHSANRLTVGIVIAALIIGSSIVMTVKGGPTLLGLPIFGLLGFLGAVFGSMWLLYSVWRSGGGK